MNRSHRNLIQISLTVIVLILLNAQPVIFAQTTSGTLAADETWSGTINVTGDITVPYGVTLTIEPGTTVSFTALSDDTNGGADSSRCEFIINEGEIHALGTSENMIVFTSADSEPSPRDWYGFRFVNSYDPYCVLDYCDIQWGYAGVRLSTASPTISNCIIANHSYRGIYGTVSAFSMTIENNEIYNIFGDSNGYGIFIDFENNRSVAISGNEIYGCDDSGIYCDMPYQSNSDVSITGNSIHNNGDHGVYMTLYGSSNLDVEFKNNLCYENPGRGYYLTSSNANNLEVYFYGCETYLNQDEGIYATADPGTNTTFTRCSFHDNVDSGLYINKGHTTLAYCDVYDNGGYGIHYNSTNGLQKVYYCNIYGNIDYDLYNNDSNAIDARFCWWGAAAYAEMESLGYTADISTFYDIHDNANKGMIDYREWASSLVDTSKDPLSFITYPSDGDSLHRGTLEIKGLAGATAGIFWVDVSTDGGTTWFNAQGAESWTFPWNVTLEGTYHIKSRAMDNDFNFETPGPGIIIDVDDSNIHQYGTLTTDETWSGSVTVTGDIIVPDEKTLTIMPGTVVTIAALRDDTYSGRDNSRVEFVIRGALSANGRPGQEIIFTSDKATPGKRDWYGIRFSDPYDAGCIVDHCDIQWACYGIKLEDSAPLVTNNHIANIQYEGITGDITERDMIIQGNEIYNSGSTSSDWAINLDFPPNREIIISDNYVHDVYAGGLYLYMPYTANTELFMDGNIIHTCGDDGMSILAYGSSGINIDIKNTDSYNNDEYGIYLSSTNSNNFNFRFSAGEIHSNDNDGLRLTCNTNNSLYFFGNDIYHNQGYGVYLSQGRGVFVQNSIHTNTSMGVYLTSCNKINKLYYNNIFGNSTYELYNDSSRAVDARNCWWGDYTAAQMNAWGYSSDIFSIFDIHDNGAKGMVDYRGWTQGQIDIATDPVSYIIDPMEGMTLPVGDFTVKGVAAASAGIDYVDFSADGGVNWAAAEGAEQWSEVWPALTEGYYLLKSQAYDLEDNIEMPGPGVNVLVDADKLHTWGTLYEDETWSGTVNVTGDVVVPEDKTLTILPGTNVVLTALRDDSMSGTDTSRIEIIVHGALIADGEPGNRITFSVNQPFPNPGDWYGIRFADESDDELCILDYCDLQWGYIGVTLHTASPAISHCTISNNYYRGISGKPSAAPSRDFLAPYDLVISHTEISDTGSASGYGIYLECSPNIVITMNGNNIHHNAEEAIFCSFAYQSNVTFNMSNNQCHHNGDDGIQMYLYGSSGMTVNSQGDSFYSNTESGAYLSCSNANNLHLNYIDCEFYSNDSYGYYLRGSNQTYISCEYSTFHHNEAYGVYLYGGRASFSNNDVYLNDDYGIRFRSMNSVMTCDYSNIYDNYDYEIYNDSSYSVDAQYSWWGETTTADMDQQGYPANIERLYDIRDNASYGEVNYNNWLSAPIPSPTPTIGPTGTPVPPTATPTYGPTLIPTATVVCWNDGDVDDTGTLTPQDAQLSFMIYLGIIATPTHDQACSADCNGSAFITPEDAQCIFLHFMDMDCDCANEVIPGFKSDQKSQAVMNDALRFDRRQHPLSTDRTGKLYFYAEYDQRQNVVELHIGISDNSNYIDSFGFNIAYPNCKLAYVDAEFSECVKDWPLIAAKNKGNAVTAGGCSVYDAIPPHSADRLLTLTFSPRLNRNAFTLPNAADFSLFALTDDVNGYETLPIFSLPSDNDQALSFHDNVLNQR